MHLPTIEGLHPGNHRQSLRRAVQKYAVPCLDLYPRFEQAYDTGIKLYRDGIHFNPAGHHLTVAELMQFLDLHRLAPGTLAGHWPQGER
ncbi:MAG: hypothetical protein WB422_24535 [Pseudolabrys sp.]